MSKKIVFAVAIIVLVIISIIFLQPKKINIIEQLDSAYVPNLATDDGKSVTLINGKAEGIGADGVGYWSIYLDRQYIKIADLNNDRLDDIVTILESSPGGSGFFYYLAIFMNDNGNLKYLTSKQIGDRIKIKSITYDAGIITANIITQGPGEAYCCGTTPATLRFKIINGSLISQ